MTADRITVELTASEAHHLLGFCASSLGANVIDAPHGVRYDPAKWPLLVRAYRSQRPKMGENQRDYLDRDVSLLQKLAPALAKT